MGCAAACDAGYQHDESSFGPPISVIGANVGPDKPMPADGVVQIAFDRYLLPSTVIRQSVVLADGDNQAVPIDATPVISYDPVARTVTLSSPKPPGVPWLQEDQLYKVVLRIARGDADDQGLRAIDRAPLATRAPIVISFLVGPKTNVGSGEPPVAFCNDVLPILAAKCSGSTCHGSSTSAAAGLILTTSEGLARTALNRVAQGTNNSARAGFSETPGHAFGVNMPLVRPGMPGDSWLLYKVELARPPLTPSAPPPIACGHPERASGAPPYSPLAPARIAADEPEREILADYVLGREMPYPVDHGAGYATEPLTFDEREKIRLWIAQGALVPECGACDVARAP